MTLNARTPRAAAAINNDAEAVVGVEEVVSGHRLAASFGKAIACVASGCSEIGFAVACAFQILLHVCGANAPDPQLSIVSVVLRAIGSGMKVLDLACGVEDVSVLVARMAGESGAVLVD